MIKIIQLPRGIGLDKLKYIFLLPTELMLSIFSVNEKSTQESKHIHVSKAIIQYEIKDKAASPIPLELLEWL